MNSAYLLLGSNIEPEKNIMMALNYLRNNFHIVEISNTWQTKPVGTKADDFLNTAVHLETQLNAYELKEKCLCQIEELLGRVRQEDKNAPRTIDLDIVIFNEIIMEADLFNFEHMALPFSELIPELFDPKKKISLGRLAENMKQKTHAKKFKCLLPAFQK
ncbi:MAG: 2-amino-4-hydroxy-6-hydroxymethyldihydropteridine diphosphokinase [Chloroflexi bacterium]|nr:2-amino-4-hydroxy-6-hydroxymethyldihydropteridine diphosphokinase [Chloroflexota bacterium]